MKILIIAAARPNFMKVAPIIHALREAGRKDPGLEFRLIHTGQHYDPRMSDNFFSDLGLPMPDVNLEVGSGTHAEQTGRVMMAFEKVCQETLPDWVVVVGDVNSTMACAITAKKLGVKVAHVEAGLRSRDMSMPEEINRLCTDAISDLLFTTDRLADENLRCEGVAGERIRFVGNTMIDSLLRHLACARALPLPAGLEAGRYAVATLHRPSNVDEKESLAGLIRCLADIAGRIPVVFPIHPRTRKNLREFGLQDEVAAADIRLLEPVSYVPFLGLLSHSRMVLTDSGGIQEECTILGVPCLTLRNNTERPITCEIGTNILVGTDPERIRRTAFQVLDGGAGRGQVPEKWDGGAAARIVDALLAWPGAAKE